MDKEYLNIIEQLGVTAREYAEDALEEFKSLGIIDDTTTEEEMIKYIEAIDGCGCTDERLLDQMVIDMDIQEVLLGSYRKEMRESMINGFKKAIRDFLK